MSDTSNFLGTSTMAAARLRRTWRSTMLSIAGGSMSLAVHAQTATVPAPAAAASSAAKAGGPAAPPGSNTQQLEAVTISATRRREPVRDVPMQVDTLSAERLEQAGAKTLTDYLADQPGVDVKTTGGAGTGAINIRGVTTGDQTVSTVGVYIDDIAVGSSSAYVAGATLALDMSLLDLNHIELLRGPQGTLYGAGAMGGLLKYITNEPNTSQFSGKVSLGGSLTSGGAASSTESAVVNIPLKEDVAAVRVSVFRDHVGGYVDAVGPAAGPNINSGHTTGGRVSLLVEPIDRLTVRLTATDQDIKRNGDDYVDYDITTGQSANGGSTRKLSVREPYSVGVWVLGADVEYDLGWARLNSITSTQRTKFFQRADYSDVYGPALGLDTVVADLQANGRRTTQEFRLTSQAGGQFEWLAGLYYNRERGTNHQTDTGVTDGDLLYADFPSTYRERAIYGDLTWNATKRISLTGGVRVARNDQDYNVSADGVLVGGPASLTGSSAETSKTYLLTAKYALTSDSNIYTRAASGYRPGGPNPVLRDSEGPRPRSADVPARFAVELRSRLQGRPARQASDHPDGHLRHPLEPDPAILRGERRQRDRQRRQGADRRCRIVRVVPGDRSLDRVWRRLLHRCPAVAGCAGPGTERRTPSQHAAVLRELRRQLRFRGGRSHGARGSCRNASSARATPASTTAPRFPTTGCPAMH